MSRETLLASSVQHISDVAQGLAFWQSKLAEAINRHDTDKLTDIDGFHADFVHGFGVGHCEWWARHRRLNRHHLTMADGIPSDVNLVDVLDFITDCVMAGMARSGSVYELRLDPDVLAAAFRNSVQLLKQQIVIEGTFPCIDSDGTHSGCADRAECRLNRCLDRDGTNPSCVSCADTAFAKANKSGEK